MVPLEVKQQVRPDRGARSYRDVGVLEAALTRLHHGLLEAALSRAEEGHGEVPGGGGGHGGQEAVEGEDGALGDGELATEGCVHVEAAELLADLSQLGVDASQAENRK